MNQIEIWLWPVLIFFGSLIALSFGWLMLHKRLEKWASKTESQLDDQIIEFLKHPVRVGIFLVSLQLFFQYSPLGGQSDILKTITQIIMIFMFTSVIGKTAHLVLDSKLSTAGLDVTTRTFFRNAMWAIIVSIAGLVTLDTLGVSITPLLASLGVGSLAVGLALQDTLSNFFSGIYIIADKPCRVNDFIRVDSETEGHVIKIGWRSTHLRLLNDNIVVVPNSKLATAQLINYDLNGQECIISLTVGVSYNANLDQVESLTVKTAQEVLNKWPGGVQTTTPLVRFFNFGESSIDLRLSVRAQTWVDQFDLRHQLIKALHKAYSEHHIEIPFPQRVVHYRKDLEV